MLSSRVGRSMWAAERGAMAGVCPVSFLPVGPSAYYIKSIPPPPGLAATAAKLP